MKQKNYLGLSSLGSLSGEKDLLNQKQRIDLHTDYTYHIDLKIHKASPMLRLYSTQRKLCR